MDKFSPKRWPSSFPYKQVSHSLQFSLSDLRLMLLPMGEEKGFQEGRLNAPLEIRILKPPHPLAGQSTTFGHKSRGLFASDNIEKDVLLGEYTGRMFVFSSPKEVKKYKMSFTDYTWLIEHKCFLLYVDACFGGNELAFVNDYQGINLEANVLPYLFMHKGAIYFGFKTLKNIRKDEELLVDYHFNCGKR